MSLAQIVGILNVTPDSYHDGGKFMGVDAAVRQAGEMLSHGADIIDVGGESTGPNSKNVGEKEELERVIPVIEAIHAKFPKARVSIDTRKSTVAERALAAGATMINDVTAGRGDPKLFSVAAKSGVPIVLMFSKDATARTTIASTQYDDVVATIKTFLARRKAAAVEAGIRESNIVLDPGMGHFISSDPRYSLEILARLQEFQDLESPVFVSPSRKSFLAGPENLKTIDRLPGTIAASAIAVLNGAAYVRTHDVLEVRRGCEIASELRSGLSGRG